MDYLDYWIIWIDWFTMTGGGGDGNSLLMLSSCVKVVVVVDEDDEELSFEVREDGEEAETFVSLSLLTTSRLSIRIFSRLEAIISGRYATTAMIAPISATTAKIIPNTKAKRKPIIFFMCLKVSLYICVCVFICVSFNFVFF